MKIVWLSNKLISDQDSGGTGTWLDAMAQGLLSAGNVELHNIATGKVEAVTRSDSGPLAQWVLPDAKPGKNGLPPKAVVAQLLALIAAIEPDVVHVWGTENYWGLLHARGFLQARRSLLEIQGLKEPCSKVFAGGLTRREQLACVGLKELIKGRSIGSARRAFARWAPFEREIIMGHAHIATQSPWVEAWVKVHNPSATLYPNELPLRRPFYDAMPWRSNGSSAIFCSAAYPVPYKGLHDAVRALALLAPANPKVRLRIAGALQRSGLRQDGYVAWLNRLAASLGVADRIDWLGPLSAPAVVAELQSCAAMLMPSHCETYCVAFAEALYLGVPTVSAHTGGTDWLARDEETALFYSPGDEVMCAYQLARLLTNDGLAEKISNNARVSALERNCIETIIANRLEIYRQVCSSGAKR